MSINLDEIERAVAEMTPGEWKTWACHRIYTSGDEGINIASVSVPRLARNEIGYRELDLADDWTQPSLNALGIVTLRNSADELLRLARIGQATEAAGKGGRQ